VSLVRNASKPSESASVTDVPPPANGPPHTNPKRKREEGDIDPTHQREANNTSPKGTRGTTSASPKRKRV